MLRKPFFVLAALLGVALVTTACDDDDVTEPGAPTASVAIRAVHASPDAPAVDIYVEGLDQPLYVDVAFGEVSDYVGVPAGTYNIQIRPAGAPATSDPVFETGPVTVTDGDTITAIATGFLGSMDADDMFRVLPLFENFDAAGNNAARVRIVHASPDAPTVSIDVGDDGSAEIGDLGRFEDTGASGVDLPAGTQLQIAILAGNPLARVTAFTTPALPAGADLFVIAIGELDDLARQDEGFSLLAVARTGLVGRIWQNPVVYALHAGPDAPAVDIFAGDAELVDDLAFSELSGWIQVPPGSYTLDFFGHAGGSTRPAGAPVASFDTPSLEAGFSYLAVASGFLNPDAGEEAFTLLAYREDFEFDETAARIRAIHGSPDAPAVDIGTVAGGTIDAVVFGNVAFAESSDDTGASVPAASLTLGVAPTGDINPVATFDVTTAADLRAFAVAVGALDTLEGSREGFRLVLVNTSMAPWAATPVVPNIE